MYKKFFKRVIDILVSVIALPLLLPVFIIFAPIIYFTDKGPIFYNAQRVGKDGKLFKMYKFRSMYVNAPDIRLADGSTYNGEDDPRVTPIGRFIRKTSIDELPQILNILVGHMSLIGPRPDPPDWLDRYPEDIKVFLTVRPGITGYAGAASYRSRRRAAGRGAHGRHHRESGGPRCRSPRGVRSRGPRSGIRCSGTHYRYP